MKKLFFATLVTYIILLLCVVPYSTAWIPIITVLILSPLIYFLCKLERKNHAPINSKNYVSLILIVLITVIPLGYKMETDEQTRNALLSATNTNIEELIDDYLNNEVNADLLYENKGVIIKGIITKIDKNIYGDIYIELNEKINCKFGEEAAGRLRHLSLGSIVVVKGVCRGKMISAIVVDNCQLR